MCRNITTNNSRHSSRQKARQFLRWTKCRTRFAKCWFSEISPTARTNGSTIRGLASKLMYLRRQEEQSEAPLASLDARKPTARGALRGCRAVRDSQGDDRSLGAVSDGAADRTADRHSR